MKHVLYFFHIRKGSRIDLFWARSDIYVVNFDLFVFIEGVIFQKGHSNIKVVVWYGDSRFQRFLMISSLIEAIVWHVKLRSSSFNNGIFLTSDSGVQNAYANYLPDPQMFIISRHLNNLTIYDPIYYSNYAEHFYK